MELVFLGTSAGLPTRRRNVTSLALKEEQGRGWIMVDCGEATQHQLLRTSLSLRHLKAICITHVHGDHCYGLPGVLASAAMNGRTEPLTVIAPEGIQEWLEATQRLTAMYLPFELIFRPAESLSEVCCGSFRVSSTELSHRVPCWGYVFQEQQLPAVLDTAALEAAGIPAGPVWGQLKKGLDTEYQGRMLLSRDFLSSGIPGRKLIICGDNCEPEKLRAVAEGCQLLVHEATYTRAVAEKAADTYGHSTAADVAAFAEAAGIPALILTHFSSRFQDKPGAGHDISEVAQDARDHYRGNLFMARDFAAFRLDRNGCTTAVSPE